MNRIIKFISLSMALLLIVASLTGCSTTSKTEKAPDSSTAKQDDNAPVSSYPIVNTPLTLKYWRDITAASTQYMRSYSECESYQEMEKRTGIHIEFTHPAQGQIKEQFNLMIASGDLPDIITGAANYKGGEIKGVDDEVFLDLTPNIQKYAPDYYKLVTSTSELRREVTSEDGRFIAFYQIKPVGDPPARRVLLRKDWLAELMLDIPKTIDDYEKMFKALKEKKNVIPYALINSGLEEQFMGAFGVMNGFYLKDAKTVAFGQIQPQFKDYLALMNKWFTYGYISKDFPTINETQRTSQFNSGRIGMHMAAVAYAFNLAKEAGIDLVSAPYPRIKQGDKLHWESADAWPRQGYETVISNTSKNKIEAIRWLNYAYTKDGSRLLNYGVEGKSWVLENGKPKYTDYMFKDLNGDLRRVQFAPKLMDPGMECNPSIVASKEAADIRRLWSDDKDVDTSFVIPPINLTAEESDKRAKIMTDINTYVNEMVLKFITGAEPLSKFDEYVSNIKKLNIDEAVKITQNSYDRYMSKK